MVRLVHPRRLAVLAPVAAIGLTATFAAAPARADDAGRWLRLSATASATATVDAPTCGPTGRCVIGWDGTSTLSGGMQGAATSAGTLVTGEPGTAGYVATYYSLFTGTVTGCGTGTVVLYFPPVDASDVSPFPGQVDVLPGTGTGELAGLRGRGTYEVTPSPTGSITRLALRLRCGGARSVDASH